jgi:hypothetical protein
MPSDDGQILRNLRESADESDPGKSRRDQSFLRSRKREKIADWMESTQVASAPAFRCTSSTLEGTPRERSNE